MEVNAQTKDFFASKTSWGMILVALQPVLSHFGLALPVSDEVTDAFIQGAGASLFLWGQLSRTTTISSVAGINIPGDKNAPTV